MNKLLCTSELSLSQKFQPSLHAQVTSETQSGSPAALPLFVRHRLRASAIDTDVTVTRRAARGYVRTKSYRAVISTGLRCETTSIVFLLRKATGQHALHFKMIYRFAQRTSLYFRTNNEEAKSTNPGLPQRAQLWRQTFTVNFRTGIHAAHFLLYALRVIFHAFAL